MKNIKILLNYLFQLCFYVGLSFSGLVLGQDTIKVDQKTKQIDIYPALEIYVESEKNQDFSQIQSAIFTPLRQNNINWQTEKVYWLRLCLHNTSPKNLELILDLGNWSYADVYLQGIGSQFIKEEGGYFLPFTQRIIPQAYPYLQIKLIPQKPQFVYFRLEQKMSFYLDKKLKATLYHKDWLRQENDQRLFYQGIFLGIIWVMALYNLVIYFSVKDLSSLYYVLSLVGVGLYFMFYYGFALEMLWPNAPVWNAYCFVVIVPLTRITWVLFTQSYLNLKSILPQWNQRLYILILLYLVPIILGLFNYFTGIDTSEFTIDWIGVMGVIVLSMMILMGILAYQKGYQPALYFLIANMFFSLGSIMFILREIGFLVDTFITQYSGQIGVIMQVILFSLGLADRLNKAQQTVIQRDLEKVNLEREKEREKQQLIEAQKVSLEREVKERTADLEEKTEELEITVQKLQESEQNLLDLNHVKDKFFSIISHDLRSPLSTLNSFMNILIHYSGQLSEEDMNKLVKRTQKSLGGLTELLDNLLQWAKTQMNHTHFDPKSIQIQQLVDDTVNLLKVTAEEKQINLEVNIQPNLSVFADPNMLSFVLRNLLVNAFKFTHKQGKVIIQAQEEGGKTLITVQDTGIGIAQENLPKLFNIQQHFSTKGTQNEKGIGLGLYLCKEFIEKHQGTISVQSQVGKGTTFTITLLQLTMDN